MANRKSDFISTYRQNATLVLKALLDMRSLHEEARIMNYPTALSQEDPNDFSGNDDITKSIFKNGIDATTAILALLTDDVIRDLYKIRL